MHALVVGKITLVFRYLLVDAFLLVAYSGVTREKNKKKTEAHLATHRVVIENALFIPEY